MGYTFISNSPEKKEHLAEREDAQISALARAPWRALMAPWGLFMLYLRVYLRLTPALSILTVAALRIPRHTQGGRLRRRDTHDHNAT